jgi:hypothetical protein
VKQTRTPSKQRAEVGYVDAVPEIVLVNWKEMDYNLAGDQDTRDWQMSWREARCGQSESTVRARKESGEKDDRNKGQKVATPRFDRGTLGL